VSDRDYAARVSYPGKPDLLLPTPNQAQAEQWVEKINGDSTPATAVLVSRPTGGWEPVR
jgi:hypothetical protein